MFSKLNFNLVKLTGQADVFVFVVWEVYSA
jgi:hypothetical protein